MWKKLRVKFVDLILRMQHLKERKDPLMEEILTDTENMLARGRMDLPLSLCFAATRGDDSLVNQLLTLGSDPNEADANGRTAMVSALNIYIYIYISYFPLEANLLDLRLVFLIALHLFYCTAYISG